MKIKAIRLFLLPIALTLLVVTGCGGGSKIADTPPIPPTTPLITAPTPAVAETQYVDSADLPAPNMFNPDAYELSCGDRVLGMAASDSIFHQGRTPSTDELMKLAECRNYTLAPSRKPQSQPSNQSTTVDDSDKSKRQNRDDRSELGNWREMYHIPYSTSCMDDRLGIDIVSKFQNGERGPTEAEFEIIESCDIERADLLPDDDSRRDTPNGDDGKNDSRIGSSDRGEDSIEEVRERIEHMKAVSGTWIRTGDRTNDQFVLGYIPNPEEWRCGVAAVGADILRAIKAGKHTITDEENQKLALCFRAPPESLTHPLTQFNCIPLDILLEFVDYYRPSWEQLECHLEGLERYGMPKQIRSSGVGDAFGIRNMKGPLYPPLWDKVMNSPDFAEFKLNWSPATVNMGMPPSYDEEYNSMKCPQAILDSTGKYKLGEYWLSEEIRGAAIGYIIEKKKGLRIYADLDMCTNAYIVQGNLEDYKIHINSAQDFKDFALNVAIPAYAMKAKAAEKVKAELIQLNSFGNAEQEVPFGFHPALYNLPPTEQVELAQWYLDLIIAEVRKYYNGTVWVASAGRYDTRHPDFPASGLNPSFGPHWKTLSFAAADHVSFTIDGVCSFVHMKRFFNDQFKGYMEIVKRDNVTYHIMGSVIPNKFSPTFIKGCVDEYAERKIEIHTWLLSKYDALPIEPLFLYGIPSHPRSWVKDEEGWYPTAENADRGDWKLFNIDAQQPDPEIQELYTNYALSHIIED
jgi:hypothetical protein